MNKEVDYFKADWDTEIPILRIGQSVRGRLYNGKRPEEYYLSLTRGVLQDIISTEEKRQKFLRWLTYAVLPSFREKENISDVSP